MAGLSSVLPLLSLPAHAADPTLFQARIVGAVEGAQRGCVVVDAAPRDHYTVHLEVSQPGRTPLLPGQRLCVVVHSPILYQTLILEGAAEPTCHLDPTGGDAGWRFACGCAPLPGPETVVVDAAYLARTAAAAQSRLSGIFAHQRELLQHLFGRVGGLSRCPAAQSARVSDLLAMIGADLLLDERETAIARTDEREVTLHSMGDLITDLEQTCAAVGDANDGSPGDSGE